MLADKQNPFIHQLTFSLHAWCNAKSISPDFCQFWLVSLKQPPSGQKLIMEQAQLCHIYPLMRAWVYHQVNCRSGAIHGYSSINVVLRNFIVIFTADCSAVWHNSNSGGSRSQWSDGGSKRIIAVGKSTWTRLCYLQLSLQFQTKPRFTPRIVPVSLSVSLILW